MTDRMAEALGLYGGTDRRARAHAVARRCRRVSRGRGSRSRRSVALVVGDRHRGASSRGRRSTTTARRCRSALRDDAPRGRAVRRATARRGVAVDGRCVRRRRRRHAGAARARAARRRRPRPVRRHAVRAARRQPTSRSRWRARRCRSTSRGSRPTARRVDSTRDAPVPGRHRRDVPGVRAASEPYRYALETPGAARRGAIGACSDRCADPAVGGSCLTRRVGSSPIGRRRGDLIAFSRFDNRAFCPSGRAIRPEIVGARSHRLRSEGGLGLMPDALRPYEVMIILDADLDEETIRAAVERWLPAHRVERRRARPRRLLGQAPSRLRDQAQDRRLLRGLPGPVGAARRWSSCTGCSPWQTKSSVTRCCASRRRSTDLRRSPGAAADRA